MSDLLYAVFLGVAGLLGVTLLVLAGRLAHRRRTLSHALIAVALGALAGRSLVGIANMLGAINHDLHHLFEHGLDALIVVVLFAAVIAMGRPDTSSGDESNP